MRWIGRLTMMAAVVAPTGLPASGTSSSAAAQSLANPTRPNQAGYFVMTAPASASAAAGFTIPPLSCATTPRKGIDIGSLIFSTTGPPTGAVAYEYCNKVHRST